MAEKSKPDLNAELHRALNNACRKWGAREIRLRYLPKPSLNRWIADALIDHSRVIEKIRADIPAGELALADIESFSDQPIVRGAGDTAHDAIKTMWPLKWKRREAAGKDRNPRADFEVYRRNTDATAGNSRNVPPTAVSRR